MDIFGNSELWEDKFSIFNILFMHATLLYCLYSVLKMERKRKKCRFLRSKIIGYQHALHKTEKKATYHSHFNFYPLVKSHGQAEPIAVKQLTILKPEGHEISGYIDDKDKLISRTIFAHAQAVFLLMFTFALTLNTLIFLPNASDVIINYILPLTCALSLLIIIYGCNKHQKETRSFSIFSYELLWPKRPSNYEKMKEADFDAIKNKDLCSYEEAMAYHYHQSQQGKIYAYIAYAVAIAGIITALLLMTKTIQF